MSTYTPRFTHMSIEFTLSNKSLEQLLSDGKVEMAERIATVKEQGRRVVEHDLEVLDMKITKATRPVRKQTSTSRVDWVDEDYPVYHAKFRQEVSVSDVDTGE